VILESIAPLIPHLRYVSIHPDRIQAVCHCLSPEELNLPTWDDAAFILHPDEQRAAQILLFNTINFSYWGEPKWTIEFRGTRQDGAWGMLAAIARAAEEGYPLFEGTYLADIPANDLRHILRGNVEIPMFVERLSILHEIGSGLVTWFEGNFIRLIQAAGGDALALVRLLTTRFPSFEDTALLAGRRVIFYKRAQLAAAMLFEAFGGKGFGHLRHTERLTVFADYKLPQVMRRLGILEYAPELANRIDRLEPLAAGSRAEVEIRSATVWAAEQMRQALLPRRPDVTALHVDYWLWRKGQEKGPYLKPYHRTRSIYY